MATEHDQKEKVHLHVTDEPASDQQFVIRSGSGGDDKPPAEPHKPIKKMASWLSWIVMSLIFCIYWAQPIGLMRAQTLSAIATAVSPNAPWYVDNQVDLANAYKLNGNRKAAEKVYADLIPKLQQQPLQQAYVKMLLSQEQWEEGKDFRPLFDEALKQVDSQKVTKENFPRGIPQIVLRVGWAYDPENYEQHNEAEARAVTAKMYDHVLRWYDIAAPNYSKSNVQADLGQVYQDQGKYELALQNFVAAYDSYKGAGTTAFNGYRLMHIGTNLTELGKYAQAEVILQKALPMIQARWYSSGRVILIYWDLARSEIGLHKYKEAQKYLDAAVAEQTKHNNHFYRDDLRKTQQELNKLVSEAKNK